MELSRFTLQMFPPQTDTEGKTLQVPVLELKYEQAQALKCCEVLYKAKMNVRGHGTFIPPSFLKDETTSVYLSLIHI